MNYKLLFPTYRNRYLFVKRNLERLAKEKKFDRILNLGCGEGDYDPMIAARCAELVAVDINREDIEYARELNKNVANLRYDVDNALNLSFADASFDLIISVDVMEHVGRPEVMLREIQRVLKPEGIALITFPSQDFPFTYDPINRILSWFSNKKIAQGAYAFGHEYLISGEDFKKWSDRDGLTVLREHNLSGYLVALLEMYWTGIIQSIFKANATNHSGQKKKKITLRPSNKEPLLTKLTDFIIAIDETLFSRLKNSVGKGFIVRKN